MTDKTLSKITLLSDLDAAERARLERLCTWRRYRVGDRIFDRGSTDQDVYFIVEGAVRIVDFAPSGRELSFAVAQAGAMFGELAAIGGRPRSSAVVVTADCLLASLQAGPFIELLRTHGDIGLQLLQRLADMIRRGNERMLELNSLDATERIYRALLGMAMPHDSVPDLWVIDPLPPLRELARRVHADPAQVANIMNLLYPSGLLRREGEHLYLMGLESLKELVATVKSGASGRAASTDGG